MIGRDMATRLDAHRPARTPASGLRRDLEHRLIGGVCAGIARAFGIDMLLVRIAFIAAAAAGGVGIPVYLVLWAAIPAGEGPVRPRRLRTGRPGATGSARRAAMREGHRDRALRGRACARDAVDRRPAMDA